MAARRALPALVAVLVVAASCSGSASTEAPTPVTAPIIGKQASAPAALTAESIDVSVVGDWLPSPGPLVNERPYGRLRGPIAARLTADDLTIANLECPITVDAPRRPDLDFAIKCRPNDLDAMIRAGVDVVTLANDHITDFGIPGVEDTLAALDAAGIVAVGPGPEPTVVAAGDTEVAILAIARNALFSSSPAEAVSAVSEAAELGLPLIVSIHWGEADARAATAADNELADDLVAAGADVVMGHGAGQLHAFRRADEAVVFSGLGRFVWPVAESPSAEADTAVGSVELVGAVAGSACLLAATIGTDGGPAFDDRDPEC